jgi:hypothetical protein
LSRFSEELADIDPLFQTATTGLEGVLDDADSAEEDNLAGLELAEDPSTHPYAMDLDGDDLLEQMEARLARLSSTVSRDYLDALGLLRSRCRKRVLVWYLNQVKPTTTPIYHVQIAPTMGGNDLMRLFGNLVLSARGVPPQYQEYLHDANILLLHFISQYLYPHSLLLTRRDVIEFRSKIDSLRQGCLLVLDSMGLTAHSHIYREHPPRYSSSQHLPFQTHFKPLI